MAVADPLDQLAVWEPTGLSPLEDAVGRTALTRLLPSDAIGCSWSNG